MCRAVWPGHGVVDVGAHRGHIAAGEPACHIPAPDEFSQRDRGAVAGLCGIGGMRDCPKLGSVCNQFGQQRRGNDPAADAGNQPRFAAGRGGDRGVVDVGRQARPVEMRVGFGAGGRLLGNDMDDDARGPAVISGGHTGRVAATAGQVSGTGGQCADRVGATLRHRARIVLAHPADHDCQPLTEQGGIRRVQSTPHAGGARGVVAIPDGEIPAAGVVAGAPYGTGVDLINPCVQRLLQLVLGQRAEFERTVGDHGVQRAHRIGVGDQCGAGHDRAHGAHAHIAGQEQRRHSGKPVPQCDREVHLPACSPVPQRQRRADLCRGGIPVVAGPIWMFVDTAPSNQFGDPGQASRVSGRTGPCGVAHRRDQCRIVQGGQLGGIR